MRKFNFYTNFRVAPNIDTLNRIEVYCVPTVQWILCCLCADLESHIFDFQIFASRFLVTFDGTADAFNCTTSLRKARTICWFSEVLDTQDSRFVRFLKKIDSNLALALFCCHTSRKTFASIVSGPVAEWAAPHSDLSRYCCVSGTNPVKCWCSPAYSWHICCVTSNVVLEDWVLYVNRTLADLVSKLMRSVPSPSFLADIQELDLPPEKIAKTDPFRLSDNSASASCSSCRTWICTLQLCTSLLVAKEMTWFCLATASKWGVAARNYPCWWRRARGAVSSCFLRSKNCRYILSIV